MPRKKKVPIESPYMDADKPVGDQPTRGTLMENEYHPMGPVALQWIASIEPSSLRQAYDALCSSALAGNRVAEVTSETLKRIMEGEIVSDRYLLGLAWLLRDLRDNVLSIEQVESLPASQGIGDPTSEGAPDTEPANNEE